MRLSPFPSFSFLNYIQILKLLKFEMTKLLMNDKSVPKNKNLKNRTEIRLPYVIRGEKKTIQILEGTV